MSNFVIDWRIIIEWGMITAAAVVILSLVVDIWGTIKGDKKLSGEHTTLREEHNTIKGKIESEREILTAENVSLKNNIGFVWDEVKTSKELLESVDKFIAVETSRKLEVDKALTEKQKDIQTSINTLGDMFHELENATLEIKSLKADVEKYKAQSELLSLKNKELAEKNNELVEGFAICKDELNKTKVKLMKFESVFNKSQSLSKDDEYER